MCAKQLQSALEWKELMIGALVGIVEHDMRGCTEDQLL